MTARIGWTAFDTQAATSVRVGWAEFDALAAVYKVRVGWAEFDVKSPDAAPVPTFQPGGGVQRYHSDAYHNYDVPVDAGEDEEEEIILALLLEIAAHAIL